MAFFPRHFVATAVLAALALPVLAQTAPPAAAAAPSTQDQAYHEHGRHHGSDDRQMRRAPDREKMQEYMAQRQAALKQSLQLTPAQEPAWSTFIDTMQPAQRPAFLGPLSPEEMQQLTTPERIERMRAQRAQRSAEADRMGDAVKDFYAQLTPAQQKTFDAQTWRYHRGMSGMSGMGEMGAKDGYRDRASGKKHGEHRRAKGQRHHKAPTKMPAPTPAPAPAPAPAAQ